MSMYIYMIHHLKPTDLHISYIITTAFVKEVLVLKEMALESLLVLIK